MKQVLLVWLALYPPSANFIAFHGTVYNPNTMTRRHHSVTPVNLEITVSVVTCIIYIIVDCNHQMFSFCLAKIL